MCAAARDAMNEHLFDVSQSIVFGAMTVPPAGFTVPEDVLAAVDGFFTGPLLEATITSV